MGNVQNRKWEMWISRQIHRHREWVLGCQGLGKWRGWGVTADEDRFSSGVMDCSGTRQGWWLCHTECTQCHGAVHIKMVNFMLCYLSSNNSSKVNKIKKKTQFTHGLCTSLLTPHSSGFSRESGEILNSPSFMQNNFSSWVWPHSGLWPPLMGPQPLRSLPLPVLPQNHQVGLSTQRQECTQSQGWEKEQHWWFNFFHRNILKVTQSCLTLWDPMDCKVHGILQARILEWVASPFSRGSFQPRDWTQIFRIVGRVFTSCATREATGAWVPENG